MKCFVLDSPVGSLTLCSGDEGLESISFGNVVPKGMERSSEANAAVVTQLNEYFNGNRRAFDLSLTLIGTVFQRLVWDQLLQIPYGETRTYGEIARALCKPGAARAVGMANNQNPIPIIVPCHRVIGTNGTLIGYAGGLGVKGQLLALEAAMLTKEHSGASRTEDRTIPLDVAL